MGRADKRFWLIRLDCNKAEQASAVWLLYYVASVFYKDFLFIILSDVFINHSWTAINISLIATQAETFLLFGYIVFFGCRKSRGYFFPLLKTFPMCKWFLYLQSLSHKPLCCSFFLKSKFRRNPNFFVQEFLIIKWFAEKFGFCRKSKLLDLPCPF